MSVGLEEYYLSARLQPKFQDEFIGSYPAYVAEPSGAQLKEGKALIYLTDNEGICHNSRLLADEFAAWGYLTVVCFNAGVLRIEGCSVLETQRTYPSEDETLDSIETILDYLANDRKIEKIGAVGYSSGAPWVLSLLAAKAIRAGFVAHPIHLTMPLLKAIQGPLSVASADEDELDADISPSSDGGSSNSSSESLVGLPSSAHHSVKDLEVVLNGLGFPFQICQYNDVHRGFAVRRVTVTKEESFAREGAFLQAVRWMDEVLV